MIVDSNIDEPQEKESAVNEEPVDIESPITYYEVKFIDGENETAQSVESGTTISEPETPEKEGYDFLGWYKENTCENKYDFESSILENTTIFACWEEIVEEISDPEVEEGSDVEKTEIETTSDEKLSVTSMLKPMFQSKSSLLFNTDDKQIIYDANGGYFKDESETKTVTYTKNGNEYVADINLQIPNKEAEGETGFMFAGWYTVAEKEQQTDDNEWLGVVTDETIIEEVYAKWLPFNDLDLEVIGLPGVKIMDRNMGAEDVAVGTYYGNGNHEENRKLGYYYQWGNNYGFKNVKDKDPINSGSDLVSNPKHDTWGPDNYYYSSNFIKRTSSPYRWDDNDNRNLWGGEISTNSDEAKQGPCPKGYHVPDTLEWKAVYDALTSNSSYCSSFGSDIGKCLASKLKLPFAGYRYYNNASINSQGNYASYWSSSPYPNDSNAYYLYFGNSDVSPQSSSSRANGYSVRCFKNSSTKTLTLSNELSENEETEQHGLRRWEPIGLYVEDLIEKGYSFIGWFHDSGFTSKISLGSDTIRDTKTIYAKWNKNPWYTFNANGGKFDGDDEISVIKHSVKQVKDTLTTSEKYGGKTIEGASNLNVTLTKTDDYGKYHTVYIYNTIKESESVTDGYIAKGVAGEIQNVKIDGDTIGFVLQQNGPPINMVIDITAEVGYETDEKIPQLNRDGYEFSGWYEGTAGENDELIIANEGFDFNNTPVTQDRTFYAKWTPHTYTVTFDVNEGSGEYENIDATYGEEFILPTPEREGYTFEGWLSDVDNLLYSGTIEEGTGLTTEDKVTVNLTAQWKLIPVIEPEKTTSSSSGGGRKIVNNENKVKEEQEHNSADIKQEESTTATENKSTTPTAVKVDTKLQQRTLTRGEVAVMTNILLEVYPQLVEGKTELDDIANACSNYADEQKFTKDEKKAITRLCKLSIMGIHSEDGKPLDEFMVKELAKNDEFATVIERSISMYEDKDLSVVKDALKKLDNNEENVVFGTVYDVFMSIKNIFN